jgi:hypothetical protein
MKMDNTDKALTPIERSRLKEITKPVVVEALKT